NRALDTFIMVKNNLNTALSTVILLMLLNQTAQAEWQPVQLVEAPHSRAYILSNETYTIWDFIEDVKTEKSAPLKQKPLEKAKALITIPKDTELKLLRRQS